MSEIDEFDLTDIKSDKKREKRSDTSKEVSNNHISYEEFMKTVKKTRIMPSSYKNFPHFNEISTEQQIEDKIVRKKKGHIDNEQTFDMHSGDINVDKTEESNKHVSYEDFLRRVKKTRIIPLSTESLPNFEMKPQEPTIKDSTGAKKKVEDDNENILVFKSKDEEKNSEKSDNISKKKENKTKKESIKKSDEKVKEEKSKVEEEKKKEIKNSKEEILEEKQRSKEINREKEKSEEEIKSESSSVNKEKKELTSEKQKSQEIKREGEKTDQKQKKEKEENWNEILRKKNREERKEQVWNDLETEGINSDMLKFNNESNDIESTRTEINKVEPLKESIKEEQKHEDLRKGLKVGLEEDISKHAAKEDFKNLEIPEDLFYKVGRNFHCKDVESLKRLFDKLKTSPKVELYLKNQDCKNVPSISTIKGLVQKSFKSKSEYNTWKYDIKLRGIREIARERGGECLATEYKNSLTKLRFQCKNGHEFEATPNAVKNEDHWCPICSGVKKLTLEKFQDIARERGGECCSPEYKNNHTKLRFRCKNGHEFEATPSAVKNKDNWCPICAGNKRLTLKEFQDIAKERGGECLSIEYKNIGTKLRFRCENGHEFEATPNSVKNKDSWCPTCAGVKKLTLEEVQETAKKRGGKCLSSDYINSKSKLKFQCKYGHEFEAIPNDVRSKHSWCPICAGNKKLTLKEFQDIAKERRGECLSTEYKNIITKLRFRCMNGHEFEGIPNDVKFKDSWCPICSERAGERICRGLFEYIFSKDFKKSRLEWLKNCEGHQLELDGYNDELKLAFERHGEQHYEWPNYFHKTVKKYISQLSNDRQKEELCETHGVTLIEVPYWIKFEEYQDYIIKQCKEKGINVPQIKHTIDWKKYKWDTDDDSNRSLKEWM